MSVASEMPMTTKMPRGGGNDNNTLFLEEGEEEGEDEGEKENDKSQHYQLTIMSEGMWYLLPCPIILPRHLSLACLL